MVDQLFCVLRLLESLLLAAVEQVIEVPQVTVQDCILPRCVLREPETAEQLVTCLILPSVSSLWTGFSSASGETLPSTALRTSGAQRTDEQIADNPGAASKKIVEQLETYKRLSFYRTTEQICDIRASSSAALHGTRAPSHLHQRLLLEMRLVVSFVSHSSPRQKTFERIETPVRNTREENTNARRHSVFCKSFVRFASRLPLEWSSIFSNCILQASVSAVPIVESNVRVPHAIGRTSHTWHTEHSSSSNHHLG